MNWRKLTDTATLDILDKESEAQAVLIYKHSDRCHICASVREELEAGWRETYDTSLKPYLLDVINQRELSQEVARRYGVTHESPQALVIVKGKCVHHASHSAIRLDELLDRAALL